MPRQVRYCPTCEGRGHAKSSSAFDRCSDCSGTGINEQRCNQCWKWKRVAHFIGALKNGKASVKANCTECGLKYKGHGKMSMAERAEIAGDTRKGLDANGPLRVFFTLESQNRKTGPIPVSFLD